ncbi:MAG: hypothetical protein HGB18_04880 [Candidatus Moranbacteria bacterium]|nr:hypothetical protein [Candidatus Moranbacteria bacterium]
MLSRRSTIPLLTIATVFLGLSCHSTASALTVDADGFHETVPSKTLSSFLRVTTVLLPYSDTRSEIEDTTACDRPFLCLWTISRRSRETTRAISVRTADSVAISRYISGIAGKVNRDPANPIFGETPEKKVIVTESGHDGQTLDESAAVAAVRTAIENGRDSVTLPVSVTPPPLGGTDPESLGIRELIAEGTTNFRGSPKNRIWNINQALTRFQGVVIAPGEEFSFVKQLGDVDGEHGYLPELVIKNNKTEPEFGGGICQVSSTMFRAAVNAGLKITARRNHAYPVSYYKPYGMDATVYVPNPDLRFVNNTPGHVLILSSVEGTSLTFRLYGTHDGRSVSIDGPHILESNPDGSMKTTFSEKVADASGNIILNDTFPSSYKSPSLYPHPQELTTKPADWSKKQWDAYLAAKVAVTVPKTPSTVATIPIASPPGN